MRYLFLCFCLSFFGPLFGQTAQEYRAIAEAKLAADKPKDALVAIERAVALAPDSLWFQLRYAEILFDNDLYEDTQAQLYYLIDLDDNFAPAHQRLAQFYLSLNELDSSLHYFDQAIDRAISEIELYDYYVNRATALGMMRQFEQALIGFEQAYALDSTSITLLNNLALLYDDLGRIDEGIAMLKRITKLDSTFIGAYANLGFIYANLDSLDRSTFYFERALAIDPNDAVVLNNKGYLLYRKKEYRTALNLINHSIDLYPANSYAYRNRALVYFALELHKEGCRDLQIATHYEFSLRYGDEVENLYQERCTEEGKP